MKLLGCFLLILFFSFAASPKAEAKVPALIGFGEQFSEVVSAPAELGVPAGYYVGLKYDSIRLFFVPVFTWGKEYVLYSEAEKKYQNLTPEEVKEIEAKTGSLTFKGSAGALWAKSVDWILLVLVTIYVTRKFLVRRGGTL